MATPITSALLNPIEDPVSWHVVTIAGVDSPGVIAVNGIQGFDRETGWDKKKGKGTQGAYLTLTTFPPAEGSFEFLLWTQEHFRDWEFFRAILKYDPLRKPGSAGADALDIYHPSLADIDINKVVTHKIGPIRHVGKALYAVTVTFIEWLKPPQKSIVESTNSSKPTAPSSVPGSIPDAYGDALEKRNAETMAEAARTPVG